MKENSFQKWLDRAEECLVKAKEAFEGGKKTLARQALRLAITHIQEANWSADLHAMLEEEKVPGAVPQLDAEPMPSRSRRHTKKEESPPA